MSDNTIYRGLDWQRTLTVTKESDGTARDLTGATVTFSLKRHTTDAAALVTLTVGSGITLLTQSGATLGQATVFLAATAIDPGNYIFDVHVTPAGETVPQMAIPPTKIAVRDHA